MRELIAKAAIEGEVIQQASTEFCQLFKVDWAVPDSNRIILRTLWEVTLEYPHPRLVSTFIK